MNQPLRRTVGFWPCVVLGASKPDLPDLHLSGCIGLLLLRLANPGMGQLYDSSAGTYSQYRD